jgi:hypothetical protein
MSMLVDIVCDCGGSTYMPQLTRVQMFNAVIYVIFLFLSGLIP